METFFRVVAGLFGLLLMLLGALLAMMVWLGPQNDGWRLEQLIYGGTPALIGAFLVYKAFGSGSKSN